MVSPFVMVSTVGDDIRLVSLIQDYNTRNGNFEHEEYAVCWELEGQYDQRDNFPLFLLIKLVWHNKWGIILSQVVYLEN